MFIQLTGWVITFELPVPTFQFRSREFRRVYKFLEFGLGDAVTRTHDDDDDVHVVDT